MRKTLIVLFTGLLLVVQTAMTVLYLLPINPASQTYSAIVHSYMEPLFVQNWGLFAPEPATSSLQLWFRCQSRAAAVDPSENGWSEWQDPIYHLFKEHHRFPFTFRGKLTYIYQSIARELLNTQILLQNKRQCRDQSCAAEVERIVRSTAEFALAKRLVSDLCQDSHASDLNAIQFQVLKVFPKPYSERKNANAVGRIETATFAPVPFGAAPY